MDNKVMMVQCPSCTCIQAVYIDFTLPFEPYVYECLICKEVVVGEDKVVEIKPFKTKTDDTIY